MGPQYLTREEIYELLVKAIQEKLTADKRPLSEITVSEFGLSERQFYYLKKILKGASGPHLSESKIKEISEKIGLKMDIGLRFLRK